MPLVSVIVPVYNAGKYFTTLLDSILAQTFTQFELILVLDCPTDGSDKVAKAYAMRDNRIVIIENESNLNIGCSRNKGLQMAQGAYIAFADHDDYVQSTWLEKLYQKAVQVDADVVVSDIENRTIDALTEPVALFDEGKDKPAENSISYYRFPQVDGETLRQGMLQAMVCSKHSIPNTQCFDNANSIWNQLYKRSFLQKNRIVFVDNKYVSYEDALFNIEVFAQAQKLALVPEALYVHLTHQSNAFGSYAYKSYDKITKFLGVLHDLSGAFPFKAEWVGEAVFRKLYVCVFNEYHFKGLIPTLNLLLHLRRRRHDAIFNNPLRCYRKSKPTLSIPKQLFLLWLS